MPPELSAMQKLRKIAMRSIAKVLTPHLSKGLGNHRQRPPVYWKQDPRPLPETIPFDPACSKPSAGVEYAAQDMRRPYRILCLDGGGVRGLLTVKILQRIVKRHPQFLDQVDAIVGTSVGGIMALLLASGYSPNKLDEIFEFSLEHIFTPNPWRVLNPWRAKYSDKSKQELFQHFFGERKMTDLKKACSVIAFRLDGRKSETHSFFDREGWRPAVFSNMHAGASKVLPDQDLAVWDAAMRTSAAPTMFPVFKGYVDGGITANNPSILAISKAIAHLPHVSTRNCVLLSLGAGTFPRHTNIFSAVTREGDVRVGKQGALRLDHADWGIKQWIPFLLDLLLDGDSVTTEMVMGYLLGKNGLYHRLDPALPRQIALDDVSAMQELRDFGEKIDLTSTFEFIEKNFIDDYQDSGGGATNTLDSSSNYSDEWVREINKK